MGVAMGWVGRVGVVEMGAGVEMVVVGWVAGLVAGVMVVGKGAMGRQSDNLRSL